MDYVHFNPMRHGLVVRAADWPYSSFRRCVGLGIYPIAGPSGITAWRKLENGNAPGRGPMRSPALLALAG